MKPKVSIIIPCFNQALYLPKAIESLLSQTLTNWECIIVDDGSTDNSADIVKDYCAKDQRFFLFQKENGGSATARNMGLEKARGEYIQFLDADDSMDSRKLERQVTVMDEKQLDMSYTGFKFLFEDGSVSKYHYAKLNACTILTRWGVGGSIPPHAFLYRAVFIRKNHIVFDNNCRYREDWNWLIQCFKAQPRVDSFPDYCGAYYFQNTTGKTSSYIKMQNGNFIFMAYKAPLFRGVDKFLWAYRISEELWIWLLRMIKHDSTENKKSIHLLFQNAASKRLSLAAILLMPISVFSIMCYFIKTYVAR